MQPTSSFFLADLLMDVNREKLVARKKPGVREKNSRAERGSLVRLVVVQQVVAAAAAAAARPPGGT
jgi:hypothetical protein